MATTRTPKPKIPKPPYDSGKIPYPVTPVARARMITWATLWHNGTGKGLDRAALSKRNNNDLAEIYLVEVNDWYDTKGETTNNSLGQIENTPVIGQAVDATLSVGEFLGKLGAFIFNPVRMGELVIGVILVGVGVNGILHNPGSAIGKAVPVSKAVKAVKTVRG